MQRARPARAHRVAVRESHVCGFGDIVDVKSDAAGDARLCFHVDTADDGGHLVYSELIGSDAAVHVPYYELAAVYQSMMCYGHEWRGKIVRFGVDSAPVVAMINTGTSQDDDLMRLLRQMADCTFLHDFSFMAVHVTRSRNTLADQGTRHATPQDFNAYLGAEGYSRLDAGATPLTCPEGHSQLQCDGISRLRLGPRSRRTGRLRPRATPLEW